MRSLEEMAFLKGKRNNDAEWSTNQEEVMEVIVGGSSECRRAGKIWIDERFNPNGKTLVDVVKTSAEQSFIAGKEWTMPRSAKYFSELVEGVTQSPTYSRLALRTWVVIDSQYKGQLVSAVAKSAEESYFLVKCIQKPWENSFYLKHRVQLLKAISSEYDNYKSKFETDFIIKCDLEIVHSGNEKLFEEGATWMDYVYNLIGYGATPNKIASLSFDVSKKIIQAHQGLIFSSPDNQRKRPELLFFTGAAKTIQDGTITQWADYVIDHFNLKEPSIGGDNYRTIQISS